MNQSQPARLSGRSRVAVVGAHGMHHIDGMLALWGTQVQAGKLAPCTNRDVAPTILALLDVPIPAAMHAQVMPALRAGQAFRTYQQRVGKESALSSA